MVGILKDHKDSQKPGSQVDNRKGGQFRRKRNRKPLFSTEPDHQGTKAQDNQPGEWVNFKFSWAEEHFQEKEGLAFLKGKPAFKGPWYTQAKPGPSFLSGSIQGNTEKKKDGASGNKKKKVAFATSPDRVAKEPDMEAERRTKREQIAMILAVPDWVGLAGLA